MNKGHKTCYNKTTTTTTTTTTTIVLPLTFSRFRKSAAPAIFIYKIVVARAVSLIDTSSISLAFVSRRKTGAQVFPQKLKKKACVSILWRCSYHICRVYLKSYICGVRVMQLSVSWTVFSVWLHR